MDLVCLDLWEGEWPSLPWFFTFSFFQDWFSIWPNQSLKLLNQTEPIGLTWAGWNMHRTGKKQISSFWKDYQAEAHSSSTLPASDCGPDEKTSCSSNSRHHCQRSNIRLGRVFIQEADCVKRKDTIIQCKDTVIYTWFPFQHPGVLRPEKADVF